MCFTWKRTRATTERFMVVVHTNECHYHFWLCARLTGGSAYNITIGDITYMHAALTLESAWIVRIGCSGGSANVRWTWSHYDNWGTAPWPADGNSYFARLTFFVMRSVIQAARSFRPHTHTFWTYNKLGKKLARTHSHGHADWRSGALACLGVAATFCYTHWR